VVLREKVLTLSCPNPAVVDSLGLSLSQPKPKQLRRSVMVDWLVYHPRYQVLVYRVHGYAISNLASHLADKHKDINVKSRNMIVTKYSRLQLSRPPNIDFSHSPRDPIPAVNGLAVQKGFACGEYGFVTTSWKKLRVHCRERKHAWVLSKRDLLH
jgi:hypothetical protein